MYIDKFGFIHTPKTKTKIDYMKELDRLYKKAFPISKDNDKVNEIKKLHKLINDNARKNSYI